MKLSAFRTLNAVLRGGSFAAAAADMNLSPSAVSLQMKQMEEYFGQPLFDRSALQVRPNAFAAEIDAVLQDAFTRLETLRRRSSPAVEGRVRLGTIEPLQVSLLPRLLRQARQRYPLLDVRPVRGRGVELVDRLKSGELDAAIIVRPESGGSSRLSWTPLFREKLVLITPPDATETDIAELFRRYDWLRLEKLTITGRIAARFVADHAPHARSRFDIPSLAALTALVSEGLGITVLPEPGAHLYAAHPVRVIQLGRTPPYRQIAYACRATDQDNRLVQAVLACARPDRE